MAGALEFTLNGRLVRIEDRSPNTTLLEYLRSIGLTGSKEGCAEGDCGACSVAIIESDASGRACYRAINSCLVPLCLMACREIVSVEGVASKVQSPKSKVQSQESSVHSPQSAVHGPRSAVEGREIEPVGLACGWRLHPVQQKMVECHGSQCGYCTPGIIMSLFERYYRGDLRKSDQLDDQLCGNLCRCTGYRAIREAAIAAMVERYEKNGEDPLAERLEKSGPRMVEAQYECNGERFFRPASLVKLLELLKQFPDARLIAGATELGLDITKRYKKFPTLISVEAIPELRAVKSTESEWHIGAAATLTQIEEKMADEFPALGRMLRVFGSRQVRNRATMGGNLVTASPIGDCAPVLLALDAKVVMVSLQSRAGVPPVPNANLAGGGCVSSVQEEPGALERGVYAASTCGLAPGSQFSDAPASPTLKRRKRRAPPLNTNKGGATETPALVYRTLPISEFFVAYRQTALVSGEILHSIIVPRFPAQPGVTRKTEWYKVSKRREMDISTVAGCFMVDVDKRGIVRHVRLAYGGVAEKPARALLAEAALVGKPWTAETIREVLPILQKEFIPISDVRGEAAYRRGLITSLLEKFYCDAAAEVGRREAKSQGLLTSAPTKLRKRPPPHESANKHVTGEAMYTDDQASGRLMLEVWPVCAPYARAKILRRDASAARAMPEIRAVLLAEDVPGENDAGTKHDEILLPDKEVSYHGQIVALVVGETAEACRAAAEKVVVEYEPLVPVLTLEQAIGARSFHNQPNFIRRGSIEQGLTGALLTLEGTFALGGQEHFYLETHAAWAEPGEDGAMFVASSTQHPSEVQSVVAHVLHQPINKVVVQCPRMGGGFGGKETQAALPAALAALAAHYTGRSVRVRFNRDQDMTITGHRHPFLAQFKVGFDQQGRLLAARVHLYSNGGWALDLSQAVTDRALFHLDNAYYIPSVEFRGQVAKTNLSSNTAFRGFGGPQGMLVIEEIIDRIARRVGLPPEVVRERNLYRGRGETNTTHYGQELGDRRLQTIWRQLKKSGDFVRRRKEIAEWNAAHPNCKRGLAITPVKFGISFTVTHLNQAGALVLIYQDGTVQVNHGGTEMGQGVHTNIALIAAKELGLGPEQVRVMPTSTDKVPNTSATAASCGTDLNGAAVKNACEILRLRLASVAADLLAHKIGRRPFPEKLVFADGGIHVPKCPRVTVPFAEVVRTAYLQRVSLSATGYYATPSIHWDRAAGRGKPFHYFAYGAAVSEVEVDGFTGMMRVQRVDILHDAGDSINEGVNRGQIEGGFVQGLGWLTTEELKWDDKGRLLTHSPDTYKIPTVGDIPQVFNVTLLKNATQKNAIYGSKAVGEPPLMLAISVREAIRDAVAAFGPPGGEVPLASPATCEAIFMAIQRRLEFAPQPTPRYRSAAAGTLF